MNKLYVCDMEELTVNNIVVYWEKLKEFYTTEELNSRLGELTIKYYPEDNYSTRLTILDFGEIIVSSPKRIINK